MIPVLAHANLPAPTTLFDGLSQGALLVRVVVGLTLSAQHAVVLVHVHTTASGTDFTFSGTTVTQRV